MAPIIYDLRKHLNTAPVFGSLGFVSALTAHHTVTASPLRKASVIKLIEQMDQHHRSQGWGGLGYHYVVDRLGRIYKCRPVYDKGAHTALHNSNNAGIAFLGDYSAKRLRPRQRAALRYLVTLHSTAGTLRGHREWPSNPTVCPGRILEDVQALRAELGKPG